MVRQHSATGHRFKIYGSFNPTVWHFCIQDNTAGTSYHCTTIVRHWTYGDLAWWATENKNTASAMGPCYCGGGNDIDMYWMQYSTAYDSGWSVTTDNVVGRTDGSPVYWHSYVYNANYSNDAFRSHTDDH